MNHLPRLVPGGDTSRVNRLADALAAAQGRSVRELETLAAGWAKGEIPDAPPAGGSLATLCRRLAMAALEAAR
ncbi:hypothetical protein [Inquilinus sp. CAU 1745]|uniref:hypothetical protein n=1 Tax=Inquilinus sp. CAU 1745 TaxID=3140369 RepID=UPI00325AF302